MSNYQPITLRSGNASTSSATDSTPSTHSAGSGAGVNDATVTDQKIDDYVAIARQLLKEAADNPGMQTEAVVQIVHDMLRYNNANKMYKYVDVLCREFSIKKREFDIAIKEAKRQETERLKEEGEQEFASSPLVSRVEQYLAKKYSIYFNIISNKFMYRETEDTEFDEMNIDEIYRELQKVHLKYSLSDLKSLMKSGFVEKRNVFVEYFQSLSKWDGVDHIQKLSEYIQVQETDIKRSEKLRFETQFKKMFVRVTACALERGWNKQCFTLVHDVQNSGKSTFLRWLVPPALENYYAENIGTGKDDLIALTENLIINIDELSTLSKHDINALKSVMSKDRIKVRLPYGDRPEILQRRCSFVASTNRLEFLSDETGSVRWVCFLLKKINWDYCKDIDINKVWAQAYHLLNNAEFEYQMTAEEIRENEEANKSFLIRTPEMELIQKYFVPADKEDDGKHGVVFMTASDIVTYLQVMTRAATTLKLSTINMGKAMVMLNFKKEDKYIPEMQFNIKGYYMRKLYADEMNGGNGQGGYGDTKQTEIQSWSEKEKDETVPF